MEIILEPHTIARAEERGTNEFEIKNILINGTEIQAKVGRKGKTKVFNFNKKRLGKYYEQKKVDVIYIIENNKIITITVYVYYGKWEDLE